MRPVQNHVSAPRTAEGPLMATAQDVYRKYYEDAPQLDKKMLNLAPFIIQKGLPGIMVAGGALGFLLTPSKRMLVKAIGGILLSRIGRTLGSPLEDKRDKAAKLAVAELMSKGETEINQARFDSIASKFDLPQKQFKAQLGALYRTLLVEYLKSDVVDTKELSELLKVPKLLKLSRAEVGQQVYEAAIVLAAELNFGTAAKKVLEDPTLPKPRLEAISRYEPTAQRSVSKFVFLAERILSQDESPEGYRYEKLRLLTRVFPAGFSGADWQKMAEDVAIPFYEKALNMAVVERKPATAKQLESIREALGVPIATAEATKIRIFNETVEAMLDATGTFTELDKERLAEIQPLLDMDPIAYAEALRPFTAHRYQATFDAVASTLSDSDADTSELSDMLAVRQRELLIDSETARSIEETTLRNISEAKLKAAISFSSRGDRPAATESVKNIMSWCDRVAEFMVASKRTTGDLAEVKADFFEDTAPQYASETPRHNLYKAVASTLLDKGKVDAEELAILRGLPMMLGLTEMEATGFYKAIAQPVLSASVIKVLDSAADDEAKKIEVQTCIADLGLSPEVSTEILAQVYSDKMAPLCADARILTKAEASEFAELRGVLGLEMDDVYLVHEDLCGEAFTKAVTEVVTTEADEIPEEYWAGLDTLADRLGLSDESKKSLTAVETLSTMKQKLDDALEELEEFLNPSTDMMTEEDKKKAEAAKGNGTEKFALLACDLVSDAARYKLFDTEDIDGQQMDAISANLRDFFPGSAKLNELYKQYLIQVFSGTDQEETTRLFEGLAKLSLVLGLRDDEIEDVHTEIGTRIFTQYNTKALAKGKLDEEDYQFLNSIQAALGMKQALCDRLIRDQQIRMLKSTISYSGITVDQVEKAMDMCDSYKVDMKKDLGASQSSLENMFSVMVQDLFNQSSVSHDDLAPLEEWCKPLHISEERAMEILMEVAKKELARSLNLAEDRRDAGQKAEAAAELTKAIEIVSVMGVPSDYIVPLERCTLMASQRKELIKLYQGSDTEVLQNLIGLDKNIPAREP